MKFRIFLNESKIEPMLRKKFPEVRLVMKEFSDYTILQVILIQEKQRGKGEARAFMEYFVELSDKFKKDIYLTPSDIYGGDVNQLKKFYKSLGFVKNETGITSEKLVKVHS